MGSGREYGVFQGNRIGVRGIVENRTRLPLFDDNTLPHDNDPDCQVGAFEPFFGL